MKALKVLALVMIATLLLSGITYAANLPKPGGSKIIPQGYEDYTTSSVTTLSKTAYKSFDVVVGAYRDYEVKYESKQTLLTAYAARWTSIYSTPTPITYQYNTKTGTVTERYDPTGRAYSVYTKDGWKQNYWLGVLQTTTYVGTAGYADAKNAMVKVVQAAKAGAVANGAPKADIKNINTALTILGS